MPAFYGTWQVVADEPLPPQLIAMSRKLVGGMLEVGVPQRTWNFDDGSSIHALIVNGVPKVTIKQAKKTKPEEDAFSDLWVPRGFVVYPAFNGAKFGYGLPIITDSSAGPYDPANLAPGLVVARWTPGGPCGEVLISQDMDAGYPASAQAIPVPLLYHPALGPTFHWDGDGYYDQREAKAAWKSYRMELAAPVANYSDEDIAGSLTLFALINSYRDANAQKVLNLQPRGYYRPAKVMASIMRENGNHGATSTSYPATYQTEDDRTTKDGFSADVTGVAFDAFNRGDHLTSYELRAADGSAGAMTVWQADPATNDRLLKDVGPAAFADVGSRGGFICADVIERHRWIQAGNMNWQSPDESLPPISWHGFASLNLAWETYPATYDTTNYPTAPLIPLRGFTDGQGDCWLSYPRSSAPKAADTEPAMGRHIYCRGRAIALAPRGGLVWATGVVQVDGKDRLLALVHHPDETPTDYTHEGFTRYLRVWWCDVPKRASLRLDPQKVICGIDVDDAYAWKGGEQIDVGKMPSPAAGFTASPGINSLKYASQWRFAPDGKHAICMRDYGTFDDYSLLGTSRVIWSTSIHARAIELSFDARAKDTVTTVAFHDYTAGGTADDRLLAHNTPPETNDVFGISMYEVGAYPIAVDYDKFTGNVTYAFSSSVVAHQFSTYEDPASLGSFIDGCSYTYLGIGGATTKYASDLAYPVLHGAKFHTNNTDASDEIAVVLDVRTASFAAKVTRPRFSVDPAAATALNKIDRPCSTFTGELVNGVRLFRFGTMTREDWYPCPDGALFTMSDRCFVSHDDSNKLLVDLPLTASAYVQGHYAERSNQVVFGYQVSPTPLASWMLGTAPNGSPCGCELTNGNIESAHLMTATELAPRGGVVGSSVPMPANDWLIYSKVV